MAHEMTAFTTPRMKAADGVRLWADALAGFCGRLQADAAGADSFDGRMDFGRIGRLRLGRFDASRHRVAMTADLARTERQPMIKVVFQIDGESIYELDGERLAVRAGDCLAYAGSRPHVVTHPSRTTHLAVAIPGDIAAVRGFDPPDAAARRLVARRGIGRLAQDMVAAAIEEMPTIAPDCEEDLAQAILDILYLSMCQPAERPPLARVEPLNRRAKALIRQNLHDPNFRIQTIASALNCTKRSLHLSFAHEGTTISDYIWMARLEQCRRDLIQPQPCPRTITDVAFSWGFSSSSHFSRAFKKHFGFPPSSLWRAEARH